MALSSIVSVISLLNLLSQTHADPIEKARHEAPRTIRPQSLINIPDRRDDEYIFGTGNVKDPIGGDERQLERRDNVCESQATVGCMDRCITLEENCMCASNRRTYRNQCELSCMRKVNMQRINWDHHGKCEAPCPGERAVKHKEMIIEYFQTEYLKKKHRRCSKLTNCAQAKVVLDFTEGTQRIMECPEHLPAFLLFTGLLCPGIKHANLEKVFKNEPIVDCNAARIVTNRMFNDRNCARTRKGLEEKELVQWSFDKLDANVDRRITENEFSVLSFLPDEQCGTALFGACDADMDGSIREDEWSMCLGCKDCYRPCFVFESKRHALDRNRRFVESSVSCNTDGTCAGKQCERQWNRHNFCWCVDAKCDTIEGTESYAEFSCG